MCQLIDGKNQTKKVKIIQIKESLLPPGYNLTDVYSPLYFNDNILGFAEIDKCMVKLVEKFYNDGFTTMACCCGHDFKGERPYICLYIGKEKINFMKKYLKENSSLFKKCKRIKTTIGHLKKIKWLNNLDRLLDGRVLVCFDAIL